MGCGGDMSGRREEGSGPQGSLHHQRPHEATSAVLRGGVQQGAQRGQTGVRLCRGEGARRDRPGSFAEGWSRKDPRCQSGRGTRGQEGAAGPDAGLGVHDLVRKSRGMSPGRTC